MLLCFADLENGVDSIEDQEIVDQIDEKLNTINKFATEAYNSVISKAQVICLPLNNCESGHSYIIIFMQVDGCGLNDKVYNTPQ